jgi:type II secretory pathway pseudopilin PulG
VIARRPAHRRTARPGVSLIEVLLATAIFLMSIAAIGVLLRAGSDAALEASRTNLCSRLARSKMAELEAGVGDVTLSPGTTGGTFADQPNYQWEVICGQTSVPNAYDVTVRVWNEVGTRPVEVSLSQVVLDPSLMNNAAPLQPPTTTTGTNP